VNSIKGLHFAQGRKNCILIKYWDWFSAYSCIKHLHTCWNFSSLYQMECYAS